MRSAAVARGCDSSLRTDFRHTGGPSSGCGPALSFQNTRATISIPAKASIGAAAGAEAPVFRVSLLRRAQRVRPETEQRRLALLPVAGEID